MAGKIVKVINYKEGKKYITEEEIAACAPNPKIKRLSKAGEWAKANPLGLTVNYCDLRAIMK
jgi:hypothetical protein